jgi:hypothetical protein
MTNRLYSSRVRLRKGRASKIVTTRAKSFASYAVTISVQSSTVTRITLVHRSGARRASRGAVRIISGSADLRLLSARARRRATMAMIVPPLAIVVAALGVESASMRQNWRRGRPSKKNHEQKDAHHYP